MQYGTITESSVISCNVSYKKEIDAETLVGILSGDISPEGWHFHLDTFFNELPEPYIAGVIKENNLKMEQLADVFNSLPSVLQGKNFKRLYEHG